MQIHIIEKRLTKKLTQKNYTGIEKSKSTQEKWGRKDLREVDSKKADLKRNRVKKSDFDKVD